MIYDPQILRSLVAAAEPEGVTFTFRAMFGGLMVYADGRPLASLSDVGVGLKLGADDREEILAESGAEMLRYEPDAAPSKSYVRLPDAVVDDPERLSEWVGRGVRFVASAPFKKRR